VVVAPADLQDQRVDDADAIGEVEPSRVPLMRVLVVTGCARIRRVVGVPEDDALKAIVVLLIPRVDAVENVAEATPWVNPARIPDGVIAVVGDRIERNLPI
jgi:hypothetical protein